MSGIWSSVLNLDLVIPSNGSLTPGSNTVYIGGPRLPAKLKAAGAKGAIVFYSSATDAQANYYYIAYIDPGGFGNYVISLGYEEKFTTILRPWLTSTSSPVGATALTFGTATSINLNSTGIDITGLGKSVRIRATSGANITLSPAGQVIFYDGSGVVPVDPRLYIQDLDTTKPCIKAYTPSTDLDQWNQSTRTNVTIGGVANCTVKLDWRLTPDFVLDVRYYVTFPAAPGAAANMSFSTPPGFPTTDVAPSTARGAYGLCLTQAGGGLVNMVTRIDPGIIYVFTNGTLNIATFEASLTLTIPKP